MQWTMLMMAAGLASVLVGGLAGADHAACGDPVLRETIYVIRPDRPDRIDTLAVNAWDGNPCVGASVQSTAWRDLPGPVHIRCEETHQDAGPATVVVCSRRDLVGVWLHP